MPDIILIASYAESLQRFSIFGLMPVLHQLQGSQLQGGTMATKKKHRPQSSKGV